MPGCNAGAKREGRAHSGRSSLELHDELDCAHLIDRHDHAAIAEPFSNANAPFRGDFSNDGPERSEDLSCRVVAICRGVIRES